MTTGIRWRRSVRSADHDPLIVSLELGPAVPLCDGLPATIYVGADGRIVVHGQAGMHLGAGMSGELRAPHRVDGDPTRVGQMFCPYKDPCRGEISFARTSRRNPAVS